MDSLLGPEIFTTLDAQDAYSSTELLPEDRTKTAFSVERGLWEFVRMPFGLSTASSTFQKVMNNVLALVLGHQAIRYLNNVIVHRADRDAHLHDLKDVLAINAMGRL